MGKSTVPAEPSTTTDVDASTRARVLRLVATTGPTTTSALAEALDLTSAAVRRHVGVLLDAGQIAVHQATGPSAPARRGRPARSYVVTPAGQAALPSGYAEMASQTMAYLAEVAGPDAVGSFAERRAATLENRFAAALDRAGDDPADRAAALADLLDRDGYAASVRPVGDMGTVQLCQGHCPVLHVAEDHPQLCEAETAAFSRLLGVHVQRLVTLAGGGHVCTTNIPVRPTPAQREGAPA